MKRILLCLMLLPLTALSGPQECENYASNVSYLADYRDNGWPLKKTVAFVKGYDFSRWGDVPQAPERQQKIRVQFLKEVAQLYGPDKGTKADDIYTNRYVSCMETL